MPQIWLLVLGFVFISHYGFFQFFIYSLTLPCWPDCKLEAVDPGIAIRAKEVQEGR